MSYTSKYTAEQIEDKLTQVFDSTLQTKEIELTSNGITELTADAGFLGLKSVSVNVNVPQEGGGSGGNEDGGNKIAYLKMSSDVDSNLRLQAFVLCANARIVAEGSVGYSSAGLISFQGGNIQNYATIVDALAIEQNGKVVQSNGKYVILMSDIIAQLEQSGCTRITEEEFYNTES